MTQRRSRHQWKAFRTGRTSADIPASKARCPLCQKLLTVRADGRTRAHRSSDGDPCPWRAVGPAVHLDELPPVVLPAQRGGTTPRPAPAPRRAEHKPSRLDVGSECVDCGKWLPGERSVCGSCYVKRNANRRSR